MRTLCTPDASGMVSIADRLEALHAETFTPLRLVRKLIAGLDRAGLPGSRPLELDLELRQELARCSQELFVEARVPALGCAGDKGAPEQPELAQAATDEGPARLKAPPLAPFEPLEVRAVRIDPYSADCFNGYYSETFYDQDVISSALVWLMPGIDVVPDWAMRDAWPQLAGQWDELLNAASERGHPPDRQPKELA